MLGVALHNQIKSIIFRTEYPQLKGIIERSINLYEKSGIYNSTHKVWKLSNGKSVEFGAVKVSGDENKYQGRAHDLKAFDEITHFTEKQFRFLIGWCRTELAGQRTRVICAGNPPTSSEGRWIEKYWAPWLNDKHTNPAKIGELRWFTTLGKEDVEVESGEPFLYEGELRKPKSRTFIPARVEDNPIYMAAGYKDTLQSLPEPLRSQMLYGDFKTGQKDHDMQVIPTEWVRLAQARWRERNKPDIEMTALGVDVARGGGDKTVLSPRYANWFDEQYVYEGTETPDGQYVASLIVKHVHPNTNINVDVVGVGASVFDVTKDYVKNIFPLQSAGASYDTDKSGMLTFINLRAAWWWKLREDLDPTSGQELALPDNRELLADLCSPHFKATTRGIQIESKEDIIKRLGRSPDRGDSLVYANIIQRDPTFTIIK